MMKTNRYVGNSFCTVLVGASLLFSRVPDVHAVGLGVMEVASHLDQPLESFIALNLSDNEDISTISAFIEDESEFKSLDIEYLSYLKDVKLSIVEKKGKHFIRVYNPNPLNEPFLHLLIRLDWPGGSLLREYTTLVDPVNVTTKSVLNQSYPVVVSSSTVDITKNNVAPASVNQPPTPASVNQPTTPATNLPAKNTALAGNQAEYGPINNGETLSEIAQKLQQELPQYSIYQIMQFLFEQNQQAFIDNNINGLLSGAVLKINNLNTLANYDKGQSVDFFQKHVQNWDTEQFLLSTKTDEKTIKASDSEYTDDQKTASNSNVETSKKELFQIGSSDNTESYISSSQGTAKEGELIALQEKITELQASLDSKVLENQELAERVSLLESQLSDMNRLSGLAVESTELTKLEADLAKNNNKDQAKINETDNELVIEDIANEEKKVEDKTSAVNNAVTKNKPESIKVAEKRKSTFDKIKTFIIEGGIWKWLLGLIAIIIAWFGFRFVRKQDEEIDEIASKLSVLEENTNDAEDSIEVNDVSQDRDSFLSIHSEQYTLSGSDDVDPLAEANVYMAYDRVQQAKELLQESIQKDGSRFDVKHKLLEIYHGEGEAEQFDELARSMQQDNEVPTEVWEDVCARADTMNLDNTFYFVAESSNSTKSVQMSDSNEEGLLSKTESDDFQLETELEADDPVDLDSVSLQLDNIESHSEVLNIENEEVTKENQSLTSEVALNDMSLSDYSASDDNDEGIISFDQESVLNFESISNDAENTNLNSVNELTDEQGSIADDSALVMEDQNAIADMSEISLDTDQVETIDVDQIEDISTNVDEQVDTEISINADDSIQLMNFEDDVSDFDNVDLDEVLSDTDANEVGKDDIDVSQLHEDYSEAQTQIELAKVFIDLNDVEGAKRILETIVNDANNDPTLLDEALSILRGLGK